MKKLFSNRSKLLGLALILVFCFVFAGISAYFTATDTATNEFTVGDVSLDLTEPNWDPDDAVSITPNQTFPKDPQITNDGENDEFVFLTVSVPYTTAVTVGDNGERNDPADTELFSYEINTGWITLDSETNTTDKTVTYTYAYGTTTAMTRLEKNATTVPLFDEITFAENLEDIELDTNTLEVVINAYGIQADNINGGVTAPADVWAVMQNTQE